MPICLVLSLSACSDLYHGDRDAGDSDGNVVAPDPNEPNYTPPLWSWFDYSDGDGWADFYDPYAEETADSGSYSDWDYDAWEDQWYDDTWGDDWTDNDWDYGYDDEGWW